MSYALLSQGGFRVVYPLGLWSPKLSKSDSDKACKYLLVHLHLRSDSPCECKPLWRCRMRGPYQQRPSPPA